MEISDENSGKDFLWDQKFNETHGNAKKNSKVTFFKKITYKSNKLIKLYIKLLFIEVTN